MKKNRFFKSLLNIFGPLKKRPFFKVYLNDLKSFVFFKTVFFKFFLTTISFVLNNVVRSKITMSISTWTPELTRAECVRLFHFKNLVSTTAVNFYKMIQFVNFSLIDQSWESAFAINNSFNCLIERILKIVQDGFKSTSGCKEMRIYK